MNLAAGSIIKNRYEILEPLGEGGFAYVWKARDLELARFVAIKFLKIQEADPAALDETVQRLKREAKILANLSQRNIVSVFAFDVLDDLTPFIVMEYLRGRSLAKLLATTERLGEQLVKEIVLQTCAGLDFAHKNGLIHRDLSSANIFLCDDNSGTLVKIIDFGLSRSSLSTSAKITKTGLLLGNPAYMSPESIVGAPIDCRSDIYSLGCILYEMVTGQVPFQTDSVVGLLFKHQKEYPPAPLCESGNAGGAERINAIILRCIQKDRELRFDDCGQISDALLSEHNFDEILPPTIDAALKDQWRKERRTKNGAVASLSKLAAILGITLLFTFIFTFAMVQHSSKFKSQIPAENQNQSSTLSIAGKKAREASSKMLAINDLKKLAMSEPSPERALRLYKKLLQLQAKIPDTLPQEELLTYLSMAQHERALGKFEEMEKHCQIVIERAHVKNAKIPNEIRNQILSAGFQVLAVSLWDRNETQRAEKTAMQALRYADQDTCRPINVLLGDIKLSQRKFNESKAYYAKVVSDKVPIKDVIGLIAILGSSAVLEQQGSAKEAHKLRTQAETFAIANNMTGNAAQRLFDLGMRFYYLDEFTEAERLYKNSIALTREGSAFDYIAHADIHWLGELYMKRGEFDKAENKYEDVLAFEKGKKIRSWRGDSSIEKPKIIYKARNDKDALAALEKMEVERSVLPKQ